jgi:hypothetical protein
MAGGPLSGAKTTYLKSVYAIHAQLGRYLFDYVVVDLGCQRAISMAV